MGSILRNLSYKGFNKSRRSIFSSKTVLHRHFVEIPRPPSALQITGFEDMNSLACPLCTAIYLNKRCFWLGPQRRILCEQAWVFNPDPWTFLESVLETSFPLF